MQISADALDDWGRLEKLFGLNDKGVSSEMEGAKEDKKQKAPVVFVVANPNFTPEDRWKQQVTRDLYQLTKKRRFIAGSTVACIFTTAISTLLLISSLIVLAQAKIGSVRNQDALSIILTILLGLLVCH